MQFGFKTLDDVEVEGKRVLLRLDINCSVDPHSQKLTDTSRIEAVKPTLQDLAESSLVILAHQGRPGSDDFISLEQHTEKLGQMGFDAKFIDDIFGEKAKKAIKQTGPGEILVLQNVRYFDGEMRKGTPEEVAKEAIVQELYPFFDLFVNDAFGAAHRSQPSLVGFTVVLPSVAGRLVEREIQTLTQATSTDKHPWTLVLGGSKVADKVETLKKLLATGRVDNALLGGLLSALFLIADERIPKSYSRPIKGFSEAINTAESLLEHHSETLMLPTGAAVDRDGRRVDCSFSTMNGDPFLDISMETANEYADIIRESAVVFANGPMGYFEREEFALGTSKVLDAIADCTGITVVGGGHMGAMVRSLGLEERITHISTGGGATINFLIGKKLDVVAALEASAKRMD